MYTKLNPSLATQPKQQYTAISNHKQTNAHKSIPKTSNFSSRKKLNPKRNVSAADFEICGSGSLLWGAPHDPSVYPPIRFGVKSRPSAPPLPHLASTLAGLLLECGTQCTTTSARCGECKGHSAGKTLGFVSSREPVSSVMIQPQKY